ncbi:hypothetical protein [Desulfosporosinus youngiae]|uniref:Uncharacterized protein n=1 Tax=Desulfosporosinus youngiae DSM 17734 TaxID=768710 RepID=H5Y298_9FIRM|nr:hypothetical protein [Desulfosporosinus youngiae]EHQ88446.1 hypothetical protein DesyoDRAFT_1280 [Desulfosporosinus youngiae DSM 17734]
MKKKLLSSFLIALILVSSVFGPVKTADASLPNAAIKLAKPLLARLITLVAAGLNVSSITSAEDIAGRYYESGITAPSWDAEGNLTIDLQAIDNAQNWLNATYPGLPATIKVDGGLSYIGQTLPAFEEYTPISSPRTLFHDQNFSADGLYQINILNFGAITTWMDYESGSGGPGSYNFPPIPNGLTHYIIAGSTSVPAQYQNPYSLVLITMVTPADKYYKNGSTLFGISSEAYDRYYLDANNNWVYLDHSNSTSNALKNFDGVIYESTEPVYADTSLTTLIAPTPPPSEPGHENDCVMTISDGETLDYYDLNLSMYSAFAQWGYPGGSSNLVYPYSDYLGLYN